MIRKLSLLILASGLVIGFAASGQAIGWTLVNAKIRNDFPDVKRITTSELAAWLNDGRRRAPVLLDVRSREEFAVSQLEGAEHVEPDAPAAAIHHPKDRAIVTYCSVGYRSGRFAKKLRDAGYTNVANLEGSIFRWANEGRRITQGDRSATKVHPYNRTWGLLLNRRYRGDGELRDTKQ